MPTPQFPTNVTHIDHTADFFKIKSEREQLIDDDKNRDLEPHISILERFTKKNNKQIVTPP